MWGWSMAQPRLHRKGTGPNVPLSSLQVFPKKLNARRALEQPG